MPRGDRKQLRAAKTEFAPGIPSSRKIEPLPRVSRETPQMWDMAFQKHFAERAGEHADLRLVDPKGRAHSWALPKAELPKPGEKLRVVQQPTHTREYAARKGEFEIPEGYGKGKVKSKGLQPVEVVSRRPGVLRFNVYSGRQPQEMSLIDTPKGQLLYNHTITRESGVRGAGGHEIPQSKPKYREKRPESIAFDDPKEIHQAKIDGAHVTFHLPGGRRQLRAFSYRPTGREIGVIEHTHRLPDYRRLRAPESLSGTVVRGELWAADSKGKALPAERVGALLNSSVPRSRQLQDRHGKLRAAIFDVVRHKGRRMEDAPYRDKLKVLREVNRRVDFLDLPPMAESAKDKEKLLAKIQAGKLKETKEGVVAWPLEGGRPVKYKLRPDVDTEIVGVTEGHGRNAGKAGALKVRLPGQKAVTNVGTGLSQKLREQIWKDPDRFVGRVAKVETQQVFPSGKLRAPSFKEFHIEKGKQAALKVRELRDPKSLQEASSLEKSVGLGGDIRRKDRVFGIKDGGRLVAATRVNTRPLETWKKDEAYDRLKKVDPDIWISGLAVHPEHQRQGLATALRRHLQDQYGTIMTGVGSKSDREAMEGLNRKTGFKELMRRGPSTQYLWRKNG